MTAGQAAPEHTLTGQREAAGVPVQFAESYASVWLDLLRGLAAVLVLLGHARNLLLVDYLEAGVSWLLLPFYLLTSVGHQAVVIFFVLSGYLISGSVFRMLAKNSWSVKNYAIQRLVRLWLVLVPGLVLGAACDFAGIHMGHAPGLYAGQVQNHMALPVAAGLTWQNFVGNLFFLQDIRVQTFGSNSALWSLSNEFWYYVLFPLSLFLLRPGVRRETRLLCAAGLVGVAVFIGWWMALYFVVWLAGVLLYWLPPLRLAGWVRLVAGVSFAIYLLLGTRLLQGSVLLSDGSTALATLLLLWVLLSARQQARPSALVRGCRTLSSFSFTLYVVHTPVCMLLASFLVGDNRWQPTVAHVAIYFAVIAGLLAFSLALIQFTELRTDRVRRWTERQVNGLIAWAGWRVRPGTRP